MYIGINAKAISGVISKNSILNTKTSKVCMEFISFGAGMQREKLSRLEVAS